MLLPALAKARQAANTISCKNNLKHILTGQTLYQDEYDGWICNGEWTPATKYQYWHSRIFKMIYGRDSLYISFKDYRAPREFALWLCPAEPVPFGSYSDNPPTFSYTHYGINTHLTGSNLRPTGDAYRFVRRNTAVQIPSATLQTGDNKNFNTYSIHYYYYFSFRHGKQTNLGYFDGHVESKTAPPLQHNDLLNGYVSNNKLNYNEITY